MEHCKHLFFFACPKKNQKRAAGKDDGPFPAGSLIELLCYCGEEQWGLDALMRALKEETERQVNAASSLRTLCEALGSLRFTSVIQTVILAPANRILLYNLLLVGSVM